MRSKIERCQHPLLLAAGTLPLAALLGCACAVDGLILWPVCYAVLASACMLLPGKWRVTAAVITAAVFVAVGALWFARQQHLVVLGAAAAYAVLLFVVLPYAGKKFGQPPMVWIMTGVAIHVGAQLFLNMQQKLDLADVYAPAHTPLLVSFLLFLLLALLAMNKISLQTAMPDESRIPASIRRRHRILTLLVLGLSLLISLIPALGRLLTSLWEAAKAAVRALVAWLFSHEGTQPMAAPDLGMSQVDMGEMLPAGEPSALAMWLERIAMILAAVLLGVALALAAVFLWKKLRRLVRWLLEYLQRYSVSASEDYVDEMQDTRQQGSERFALGKLRLRRSPSERELQKLPPREQIRRRYGLMRQKHPEWKHSQTARETLTGGAAQLYERARYSSHEVTAQDAERFRQAEKNEMS